MRGAALEGTRTVGESSPLKVGQGQVTPERGKLAYGNGGGLVERFVELIHALRMGASSMTAPSWTHSDLPLSQLKALAILQQRQLTVGELAASLGISIKLHNQA